MPMPMHGKIKLDNRFRNVPSLTALLDMETTAREAKAHNPQFKNSKNVEQRTQSIKIAFNVLALSARQLDLYTK